MNIWSWIHQLDRDSYNNGDEPRQKMVRLFYDAMYIADENPDLALNLLKQSRDIAEQCQELWFIQLVNHWELQYRLYNKRDLTNTLELAVQSAVETRKPHYAEFPQRICLHEDLIRVYQSQDPFGHLDTIEEALNYMESQLNPRVECFLCFQQLKLSHKILIEDLEGAKDLAYAFLDHATEDKFHLCHAYQYLCEIAYHQKQWESIGQWAYLGETVAKTQRNNNDQRIEFTMWQAVYERYQGNEPVAKKRYVSATERANNYQGGLDRAFFDALCAYHELGDELDKALKSREWFLSTLINTAQYYDECDCLMDIIRLRKALDLPIEDTLQQFENSLLNLKHPDTMRQKLQHLLNT